jgi:hypothetical protein
MFDMLRIGITFCDFFSYVPKIAVSSAKSNYKTVLGGSLSIIIGILSILACFGFRSDIIFKSNPLSHITFIFSTFESISSCLQKKSVNLING